MSNDQKTAIPCRNCGHPEADHHGSSGPWSDGRYRHGECSHGFEHWEDGGKTLLVVTSTPAALNALEKLVDAYAQAQRRDHYALTDRLHTSPREDH